MGEFKPEPKQAPPAYMVSFCDMMTLILTFFILLVSMSKEQQAGLVAKGVGSFIIALQSHGLNGVLSGAEERNVFENMRRKFNLPPEFDPERLAESYVDASDMELIKTKLLDALEPHDELTHPRIASFRVGSAELSQAAKDYLDQLAPSLQPKFRQALLIEGHADDAGAEYAHDNRRLAVDRARAVRAYLIDTYGFAPDRVQARAWCQEVSDTSTQSRYVDARLITPAASTQDR